MEEIALGKVIGPTLLIRIPSVQTNHFGVIPMQELTSRKVGADDGSVGPSWSQH